MTRGFLLSGATMHVQTLDPDADRWARIVLQLERMRAIMRMRPAS
jgi:hypothetical protein